MIRTASTTAGTSNEKSPYQTGFLEALIERDRRQTELLAADLRALTSEEGRAAIRAQMNTLGQNIASLTAELKIVASEIEQREISDSDVTLIKRYAAAFRHRIEQNPTHEQKRDLFDALDLHVKLRRDEEGWRWLDCTCGLRVQPDALPLDDQIASDRQTAEAPDRQAVKLPGRSTASTA